MEIMILPKLVTFHNEANVGVFLRGIHSIGNGWWYAQGQSGIDDCYWNYAYRVDGRAPSKGDMAQISTYCRQYGYPLNIWTTDSLNDVSFSLESREAWMVLVNNTALTGYSTTDSSGASITIVARPDKDMLMVFEAAYGTSEEEGEGIGYSGLPFAYVRSYAQQEPKHPLIHAVHSKVTVDGRCVAVGSALIGPDVGAIYSVGTAPDSRRKGYSSLATKAIVREVNARFKHDNPTILLQTEADSPVEEMYSSLGFERVTCGNLYGGQ